MKMKRLRFALLILVLLWAVPAAQAQQAPQLSSLKVTLWPEFDKPEMLVIYTFNISGSTSLPLNLTMRIPAAAGEPHAVAVGARENMVGDVPHTRQVVGEWAEISFIASMPSVQFEYYDPTLSVQGSTRSFVYHWPGDYAVDAMLIEVQQPMGARDMRISPSIGPGSMMDDGMVYFRAEVGALTAGQTFNLSIEYEKETTSLSAEQLLVQPSQPLTTTTPGTLQTGGLLPIILGALGIILIVGGGLWYWRSGMRTAQAPARKRRRTRPTAPATQSAGEIYCYQCGKRAAQNDRFCRSCGTRLRSE
jgi:hypothetical protein